MTRKMSFWSIFALVVGSQIGTGILILPTTLAPFGILTIFGILLAIIGVLCTALVFANLFSYFPNSTGPHSYIDKIFGNRSAFFVGWTYWLVSWVSSTTVVIEAVSYLLPLLGNDNKFFCLALELLLISVISILNLRGVQAAGFAEIILILMKIIPLIIIPFGCFIYFNTGNFIIAESVKSTPYAQNIAKVALLVLWGFVGLECATTTTSSVENPEKTIPKAVILGTATVAILYLINIIAIMGLIRGDELMLIRAPYVDATARVFPYGWHLTMSIISSIVCIGTLNAWTLVSAQISRGLADEDFLPKIFKLRNKNDVPYFSIILSSTIVGILLIFMVNEQIVTQVTILLHFSTTIFIFIYLICSIGLLKFMFQKKIKSLWKISTTIISIIFLSWVISETPIKTLFISSLFGLTGLPIYLFWYKK
jgi:APA family basic amino acid/polyamine antiporter